MNDLIKKIVQENVWKQINKDFNEFILKHFEKLPYKEKGVFCKLISAEDEYSNLVMENLWSEFSIKGCSADRMKELFVNEMKKFDSVKI
jgi:hypothetical protein